MEPPASLPFATERELALAQAMAEPSLLRADKDDLLPFVDACLAAGRDRAAQWRGADPQGALAGLGYVVRRTGGLSPGSRPGFHLCAMTRAGADGAGGTVELYVDEVAAKRRALAELGVVLGEEELLRMHLAHELYHALEFSHGPMTPEAVPPVRVLGLFGLRERRPACASEIAAHAFARRLTGIPICPQLVDALALMGEGSLSRCALLSQVRRARRALS